MSKHMNIMIAVIIFLAAATATFAITTSIFSVLCNSLHDKLDELEEHESLIISDKKQLMQDKLTLTAKIEEMYADNAKLAAAVNKLREQNNEIQERNSELVRINKQLTAEPTDAGAYDDSGSVSWTIDRLPEGKTNTYRCMDFRKITLKNSDQLILQEDDCTSTETGTGLRYSIIGGKKYYHAALASAYGLAIGNCFEFTLDTGYVIPVIHAEYKHAIEDAYKDDFGDPDENYAHEPTTSVIEFVYDWQTAPPEVIGRGGMFIEPFADLSEKVGNIVKVKYLGRKWKA